MGAEPVYQSTRSAISSYIDYLLLSYTSDKPGYGFEIVATAPDSPARVGRLTTPHGVVDTPAFIPVGTAGSVKSLTPDEVRGLGAQITLANTYHLWLRPGQEVVRTLGGLHRFTGWEGPCLTDSGGFQVFSLGFGLEHGVGKIASMFPGQDGGPQPRPGKALCVIDDDGVWFNSHIDGRRLRLDPASSISIQQALGADIILAFDECTSPLSSYDYTKKALDRTHRWAEACLRANEGGSQWLFGIIQGGEYRDLREESARFIDQLPFDGYAIGGSLGKSKDDMLRVLDWSVPLLREGRPRHLLGIGHPEDLFAAVERGLDLFDCVTPTRLARHGTVYTPDGNLNLRLHRLRLEDRPVEDGCDCYTCQRFTRSYLRHLFISRELLAMRLASIHNLRFIMRLMQRIRDGPSRRRPARVARRVSWPLSGRW